jgi:hypothetical protein
MFAESYSFQTGYKKYTYLHILSHTILYIVIINYIQFLLLIYLCVCVCVCRLTTAQHDAQIKYFIL